MKKTEKIERLLTLCYFGVSEEKLKEISKKWSQNGLDTLLNMWHTHYNSKAHECISYILFRFSEKQLNLNTLENCLNLLEESK